MTLLAATAIDYTPFYILAAGVVFVLFTIIKLRLHPFIGLTLGAIIVGLLTPGLPELTLVNGFWGDKEGASNLIKAINWSMAARLKVRTGASPSGGLICPATDVPPP